MAAVPLGPRALDGGLRTALIGVALHVVVAFAWSTVFFVLLERWSWLARLVKSRYGTFKAAALYGPFVWMAMSLIIIPPFLHRPPAITYRWWVQFFGHIPFVGYPIVRTLK